MRLSVVIITLNEAPVIAECLRSLPAHDEIIVVDSGSDDGTQQICRSFGARVIDADWPGFGLQKQRALDAAGGRWVLSLDADEQLDRRLREAIEGVLDADEAGREARSGFYLRIRSSFAGQVIRFGDWRRRKLRLFRRESGRFTPALVHERVVVEGEVGSLPGWVLHDSIIDWPDAMAKADLYAQLSVERMRARGRVGRLCGILHGLWAFLRGYLLRLGFLDGYNGLRLALANAWGTYLRYTVAARPASPQPLARK